MAPVIAWVLVALAVAAIVIVVASRFAGQSKSGFVADLRAGIQRGRERDDKLGVIAAARRELSEAADGEARPIEEIFSIGATQESPYLQTKGVPERLRGSTRP